MSINLAIQPFIPMTEEERFKLLELIISEGRMARRRGDSYSRCPPFRDEDMAISWRMGWRYELQDQIARRRRLRLENAACAIEAELQRVLEAEQRRCSTSRAPA